MVEEQLNELNYSIRADLDLALRLADLADAVSMANFESASLRVTTKADQSFVTEADLATERAIRGVLAAERPDDGIFGEEYGEELGSDRERLWIIDPIDGTSNYLRGVPMWATLIALRSGDDTVVGVVSQPSIGRRWWGALGQGAWTSLPTGQHRSIRVSPVDELSKSSFSFQSIRQWDDAGYLSELVELSREVWRDRGYGDAWPYMQLAEGNLDAVAEFDLKPYDYAAHIPIILEAGGAITTVQGDPAYANDSVLATNGRLHEQYLARLKKS